MRPTSARLLLAASVTLGVVLWTPSSQAGPPLICFPYQIGDAKSLPWGRDAFTTDTGYDRKHLVSDTVDLLKSEKSVLAHMETLRRAALYVEKDRTLGTELLAKLSWIAMDYEAAGKPDAAAWFDAGFLAAYRQAGVDLGWHPGVRDTIDGYSWVCKALSLNPDSPEMEFAAALVAFDRSDESTSHLRKAVAGAEEGSALAKSIESNHAMGGKSIKELREKLGVPDAKSGSKQRAKNGG